MRDLRERPGRRGANVVAIDSGAGLANATLQLRVTVARLFYEFLVEEGVRERNPVGARCARAGRPRPAGVGAAGVPGCRGSRLMSSGGRSLRSRPVSGFGTRLMLALAYDAGLRREELCLLATDDLDPAHRTLRIRPETTKTRRGRVVPYSQVAGQLLAGVSGAPAVDHQCARGAVRVGVAAQPRGGDLAVGVVEGSQVDRRARWRGAL